MGCRMVLILASCHQIPNDEVGSNGSRFVINHSEFDMKSTHQS